MIKAIFFDFYNTLARFWPLVEDIQMIACKEIGIYVTREGIREGYVIADDYFNRENSKTRLSARTDVSREEFFAQYEQIILGGAGVPVTLQLAHNIWKFTTLIPKGFILFDDVYPTLTGLKRKGFTIGLLSNLNNDMDQLLERLGLTGYFDLCITSKDVETGKPDPQMFIAALEKAGVEASQAIHVGDQYYSDVSGARLVGIKPVLLDRDNRHPDINDCSKVRNLLEIEAIVTDTLG